MEQQLPTDQVTRAQKRTKLDAKVTEIDNDLHTENKDTEDDSPSNNEVHPLNNPVVLTRMFELSPADVLATFRLVSKQWYQLSLKSWRSSVTIELKGHHLNFEAGDFFWEPTTTSADTSTTLQKFIEYVKEPSHDHSFKPFRKFKLDYWKFRKVDVQIEQFVKVFGPIINTLELYDCNFRKLADFRNVAFKWFPNLKKLVLKKIQCRRSITKPVEPESFTEPKHSAHQNLKYLEILSMNIKDLPISCLELFSHYPHLEALKLYSAKDEFIVPMLNAIKIIRKHDPKKLQIKDLNIVKDLFEPLRGHEQNEITSETCLLLRDSQLPLERLTIDFGVCTESKKVKEILEWHSTTLKRLDARRGRLSLPFRNFPFGVQLDNLQELMMSDRLCKSLTFLKNLPNLKKLHIRDDSNFKLTTLYTHRTVFDSTLIVENTDQEIMKDIRLERCTDLWFDFSISEKETQFLMKLLPTVEKVMMPMNTKQFRLACQIWTNLRDFKVLGFELEENAITGFSLDEVKAINKAEEKGCSREGVPVCIHPNITDLKHLQKFTMEQGEMKQAYCSIFHGFLKLPYLQSLRIKANLNDRAKTAIREKIPEFMCSPLIRR